MSHYHHLLLKRKSSFSEQARWLGDTHTHEWSPGPAVLLFLDAIVLVGFSHNAKAEPWSSGGEKSFLPVPSSSASWSPKMLAALAHWCLHLYRMEAWNLIMGKKGFRERFGILFGNAFGKRLKKMPCLKSLFSTSDTAEVFHESPYRNLAVAFKRPIS